MLLTLRDPRTFSGAKPWQPLIYVTRPRNTYHTKGSHRVTVELRWIGKIEYSFLKVYSFEPQYHFETLCLRVLTFFIFIEILAHFKVIGKNEVAVNLAENEDKTPIQSIRRFHQSWKSTLQITDIWFVKCTKYVAKGFSYHAGLQEDSRFLSRGAWCKVSRRNDESVAKLFPHIFPVVLQPVTCMFHRLQKVDSSD